MMKKKPTLAGCIPKPIQYKVIIPSQDGRQAGSVKFVIHGLYYSHKKKRWVKSDESYAQSNVRGVVERFWSSHPRGMKRTNLVTHKMKSNELYAECGRWMYYYAERFIRRTWRGVTCKACLKRKK